MSILFSQALMPLFCARTLSLEYWASCDTRGGAAFGPRGAAAGAREPQGGAPGATYTHF